MEAIHLSAREQKVLSVLRNADRLRIIDIARTAFDYVRPLAKANSWARNQLRGLRARGLVLRVGPGIYAIKKPEA